MSKKSTEGDANKDSDILTRRFSLFDYDITSILVAITSFSVFLSIVFNFSYFLSFRPSLLLLFSTSDYLSSGIYFVVLVIISSLLWELREHSRLVFQSVRKKFKKQRREKEKRKQEEEDKKKWDKLIDQASSVEELINTLNSMQKPLRNRLLWLLVLFQGVGVLIWLLCSFPRLDWLAASIILHLIVFYAMGHPFLDSHAIPRRVAMFCLGATLSAFYAGALYTVVLPIDYNKVQVVYEQNGDMSKTNGALVRVLSKSLIIRTDEGFVILDRDTPLQIFYQKDKSSITSNGIWWFIRWFEQEKSVAAETQKN